MKSKSVRPDYFFFRAFAFFAFFAFLFFAIAALLATGCGDVGTVNIVDRRSLHLDYTRATEKTPTPINTECTRAWPPLDSIRMRRARCTPRAMHMPKSSTARDENCRHRENPYGTGIFTRIEKTGWRLRAAKTLASSTARIRRKSRRRVISARPKNFFHRPRFGSVARTVNRSKTSESVVG